MARGHGSSSKAAAAVAPATARRLLADLKRLQEEPLPLAAAKPCSDEDLTLWHGVVGVEMEVTHFGAVTVPLHFLIDFPCDYPQSAPNIGFSFEFMYRGGAQYTMPDGRLKGKKVICLDVLGNFSHVHTEWKSQVGTGWSPAYTVTTLLVQLQSVLCDLGTQMSQQERDVTYQSAMRFCERNPAGVLELLDEDEVRERREQRAVHGRLAKICGGDAELAERASKFARRCKLPEAPARFEEFLALLGEVAMRSAGNTGDSSSPLSSAEAVPEVDSNICCFATGKLYSEALLGVGVGRERRNLTTAGELLSKEAFDGGLRVSTDKTPFEFFLPVWINREHAEGSAAWRRALEDCCALIGWQVYWARDLDDSILEVFPRLINQMIVEMMKPDAPKSAAIATFEALCNFWRTLRYFVDRRKPLQARIAKMLSDFSRDEARRHKDETPDLGMMLVLYTVCQGFPNCPARQDFINGYADENSVRWVMWWQRSGTPPESTPVFRATQVSREIFMFQMMVVDVVIGDAAKTLVEMEATNCKLPDRLEKLQAQWRERKAATDNWAAYFRHIGAAQPGFASTGAWIADCARRAAAKGPKYGGGAPGGGAKGEGKGEGKGGRSYKGAGKGGKWGR